MPNSLQENLLLFRIRAKQDAEAFGKLYDAYVQRIYRFVYFKVASTEEAQDLTSETFLKLWDYLQSGKSVSHLGALTYRIARNLVIDHHRSRQETASLDAEERLMSLPDVAGLAKIERSAELSHVLAAVRLLKDDHREALVMRYIDGMTPTEIATVIGKSPGAVRVLLHRSLETVRTLITPKGE